MTTKQAERHTRVTGEAAAAIVDGGRECNPRGAHYVRITADHGKGKVSYSDTFRDKAGADRKAKSARQSGNKAEVMEGRRPTETLPGAKPGDVPSPTSAAAGRTGSSGSSLHDCKCGCGRQVKHLYAQGHDARHVSQLAESYRRFVGGDHSEEEVAAHKQTLLKEVAFSDRLTAKLVHSMELIEAKAAKAA